MKNIFEGLPEDILKKRRKIEQPSFILPMLATLTDEYFSSDDWFYEHKFDGERCLAFKKNGKVRLISRNNKEINKEYPELVEALLQQNADNFIIDGEIVARNKEGISDFQLLQERINLRKGEEILAKQKKVKIFYCIFDVIYVDGYDIRTFSLSSRKKVLKRLLHYNKTLLYTKPQVGNGLELFKKACKHHWEGLIVKRKESEYVGKRSLNWLKFKCSSAQELVIGGYTDPRRTRHYFGALLVGYYDHGKLQYAGKVGTGFNQETLALLGKKMKKLEIKKCPFNSYNETTKGVHWVRPMLVADFQFAQWTSAGKLRVGRYKGLRADKAAKDVVRETPTTSRVKIKK